VSAEVLVVHRPVRFDLEQTARALHAVVDADFERPNSRRRVGRSRVRHVLQRIVQDGWPADFAPSQDRIAFWRSWLIESGVFTGEDSP
jgi:hypothetical protein